MTNIKKIEISFPVNIRSFHLLKFDRFLKEICSDLMEENPNTIIWPAEHGAEAIKWADDGTPISWDDTIHIINCKMKDSI